MEVDFHLFSVVSIVSCRFLMDSRGGVVRFYCSLGLVLGCCVLTQISYRLLRFNRFCVKPDRMFRIIVPFWQNKGGYCFR